MKKLLLINSSCNSGSTGRIAEEIGETAIANDYECYFAFGRTGRDSKCHTIQIGNEWNVKKHVLSTRLFDNHGFCSTSATKDFIKEIESIQPDVINIHNIHGYYLNVQVLFEYLVKANIPIVWTLHDCWPFTGHCTYFDRYHCEKWKTGCYECPNTKGYPTSFILDNSRHNYSRKKHLFTRVKNVTFVPVCHWMENNVKASFFADYSTRTIYNGVDVDLFKPKTGNTNDLRYSLGINKDDKIILGVASIWDQRKGMDDFLRLRSMLPDDYAIVLVGLDSKQIESLPEGIKGIRRTESVDQLAVLYSLADVFVNPTYVDNFPTTNIEALACGTPVITYDTGGSPEAVDKETGYVAPKGDLHQLLSYIQFTVNHKPEYAGKCRQRAVRLFNKQDRFCEYIDLFNELTDL